MEEVTTSKIIEGFPNYQSVTARTFRIRAIGMLDSWAQARSFLLRNLGR